MREADHKSSKTNRPKTILIIGAGINGVSAALEAQRMGHHVILIDKEGPAEGASFGNGGVLASCAIVPVTTPGILRDAPRLLFDKTEPLFLKWRYLPKLLPWLARYLSHATASKTSYIAKHLTPLISDSLEAHLALAKGTGAENFIMPSDYLYLYQHKGPFDKQENSWRLRSDNGYQWQEYHRQEIAAYDPHYGPDITFAVKLPDHGRITDPHAYITALHAAFIKEGGTYHKAEVEEILTENGHVTGVMAKSAGVKSAGLKSATIAADAVILTAGIWSEKLAKQTGVNVPLETERGYHIDLWEPSFMPRSPALIDAGQFVITPMKGRLRLAGILEFGGIELGPSQAPFDLLRHHLKSALPELRWRHETQWMGFRPVLPDSLPMIGESPQIRGLFMGFGHHHIGLTGGAKTGKWLAQLATGQHPNEDLTPYDPARFFKQCAL